MDAAVQISKRLILINSISTLSRQALSITVLFWLQQYLLEQVSRDEYAVYAVLMSLMIFVPLLTGILGTGLARFITEAYARHDRERVTRIVSTMFPLCVTGALLLLAVGGTLAANLDQWVPLATELAKTDPTAADILRGESRWMLFILTLIAAAQVAFSPFRMGIVVKQKFVWLHVIQLAAEVLRIGVMFTLLFGVSTKVLWIAVASAPATALQILVTTTLARRLVPELRCRRQLFTKSLIKPILSFGGWTLFTRAGGILRETTGMLMLNTPAWGGPTEVASFRLGNMIDRQLRQGVSALLPVMQPALTAMHANGRDDRLRHAYVRFCRITAWAILFAVAPLMIFREQLYALYIGIEHESYRNATIVLGLLMARFILFFGRPPLTAIAIATGRTRPLALCTFSSELVAIGLAYYFLAIRDMGAPGLALATLSGNLVLFPMLQFGLGPRITNVGGARWIRWGMIPGLIPAVCATPVWLALETGLAPSSWLALVGCVAAGAAIYLGAVLLCLPKGERADVTRLLRRLRRIVG